MIIAHGTRRQGAILPERRVLMAYRLPRAPADAPYFKKALPDVFFSSHPHPSDRPRYDADKVSLAFKAATQSRDATLREAIVATSCVAALGAALTTCACLLGQSVGITVGVLCLLGFAAHVYTQQGRVRDVQVAHAAHHALWLLVDADMRLLNSPRRISRDEAVDALYRANAMATLTGEADPRLDAAIFGFTERLNNTFANLF